MAQNFFPGDRITYPAGVNKTEGIVLEVIHDDVVDGGMKHHATKDNPMLKVRNIHTHNISYHNPKYAQILAKVRGAIHQNSIVHFNAGSRMTEGIVLDFLESPFTDDDGITHHSTKADPMAKVKNLRTNHISYHHLSYLSVAQPSAN